MRGFLCVLSFLAVIVTSACTAPPPETDRDNLAALAAEIRSLGPEVDPEEARRAAEIAYSYTAQLAHEYQITDPPLIHNMKVNSGVKPRGLCWHWAEDMERRLNQEAFNTLTLHRAIANADNPFRIDHSTAIVSRRGDTMFDGIVLDPWRYGGRLFWSQLRHDDRYNWRPRREVLDNKRRRQQATVSRAPG